MRNAFFLFCLTVWLVAYHGSNVTAQNRIDPKLDPRNFPGGFVMLQDVELLARASDLSRYQIIDTAHLIVLYHKSYRQNIETDKMQTDTMRLVIGTRATSFYSQQMYRLDSLYTAMYKSSEQSGSIISADFSLIYHFLESDSLRVVSRLPFNKNTGFYYEEKRPNFTWKIEPDASEEILGYTCNHASVRWRGRIWNVWFTVDIPYQSGPWKFSGLPGLILKVADDSGEYIYEAIGIEQQQIPILWYEWKLKKNDQRKLFEI